MSCLGLPVLVVLEDTAFCVGLYILLSCVSILAHVQGALSVSLNRDPTPTAQTQSAALERCERRGG